MTTPPERDDDAPSDEFRQALEAFERQPGAPGRSHEAQAGTRVRGRIVSIGDEHTMVDFGGRSEGVVETQLLRDEAGSPRVKPGDTIDLFVVEAGDQVTLAPSIRADPHQGLAPLRQARDEGIPVSGRVTAVNAGGLAVDIGGVRGFCPASQIELGFCSDPSAYVGRTLELLVTELDEGRRGVVLSRRALLQRGQEERARQLLETLKPGDEREGAVVRLEPFGAFVDLGGVDGMVHVSQIRHERTAHPKDVLAPGERVRVRVLSVERRRDGKPRIALSMKAALPDPWTDVERRWPAGTRTRGEVTSLAEFGAFVALEPGIEGLVHVSEVSPTRITHPREALVVGQEVDVVVLGVDLARRRISLSIRRAQDRDAESRAERKPEPKAAPPAAPARSEPTTMAIALREAMERARKKRGE